ncbi:lipid-A-disaccharide synthase [Sediminibacterium goheungense]|uniref:Lipid-A-disaccharide synthase n=1 Tax=Sediminibacterium goheungense TaxID=1086393 RepID=A0A4R6J004_9BACT|nr:lipid-A-disaccharide synthase [Sediminibacterium goheungense]TDO28502.1 lipid-A-disaccharide synthase [Sediminibacterium goheungense]
MKYYLISGEASGDLHGSNLIKELIKQDPAANIRCWGGDLMEQAGGTLVKHYRDLAFMGFAEVVKNLPTIFRNIQFCKTDIQNWQPDVLVLIDYPGFNLRIAAWAKKKGYKVAYYISPQVWAWKESRVKKMKQCIDKMLCILPFEKDYYKKKWNWDVEYVGHPLIEVIDKKIKGTETKQQGTRSSSKPIIALLPGSRKQEISKKLPIMLSVAAHFPEYQFVVAKAPGLEDDFYMPFLTTASNISSVSNQTYNLLLQSAAALVTSGTATLETALFKVPEVVCYKGSNISYQIAKRLINIKYISLVNLIMDKLIVKELIQDELNTENLVKELHLILNDERHRARILADYHALWDRLSEGGNASSLTAKHITSMVKI